MSDPIQSVDSDGQVHFRGRRTIFDKVGTTRKRAARWRRTLWFDHNGVKVFVNSNSQDALLMCAWLYTFRTGDTEIGPIVDPELVEHLTRAIGRAR
ncbi:MAG: hypothetical protein JWP06_581 [Candidatus Saccharibacteria bacterium]|nr:hypothetical protein [Candidatus Saccharibacteria bacterium]